MGSDFRRFDASSLDEPTRKLFSGSSFIMSDSHWRPYQNAAQNFLNP